AHSARTSSARCAPRSRPRWTRARNAPRSPRFPPSRTSRPMSTHLEATSAPADAAIVELSYREAVRDALEHELRDDPTVLLMGEDVGAAGGVYKTSDGLIENFGADRIRNTPICENDFVGIALGMAATGIRPVVEIMFS